MVFPFRLDSRPDLWMLSRVWTQASNENPSEQQSIHEVTKRWYRDHVQEARTSLTLGLRIQLGL